MRRFSSPHFQSEILQTYLHDVKKAFMAPAHANRVQVEPYGANPNDGTFLMSFYDFYEFFTHIFAAIDFPQSWHTAELAGEWTVRTPVVLPCSWGVSRWLMLCRASWHMTAHHDTTRVVEGPQAPPSPPPRHTIVAVLALNIRDTLTTFHLSRAAQGKGVGCVRLCLPDGPAPPRRPPPPWAL
jgi:hypothetical protein